MITSIYWSCFTNIDGVELSCFWSPSVKDSPQPVVVPWPQKMIYLPDSEALRGPGQSLPFLPCTHHSLHSSVYLWDDFKFTLLTILSLEPCTMPGLQWVWQNVSWLSAQMNVWGLSDCWSQTKWALLLCPLNIYCRMTPLWPDSPATYFYVVFTIKLALQEIFNHRVGCILEICKIKTHSPWQC